MSERTDITDQIATLEAERKGLLVIHNDLHEKFDKSERGSDQERELGEALDEIGARLDEIGDEIGCWEARLYLLDSAAAKSRREKLADQACGRML